MPVCSAGHEVLRTSGFCKICAVCSICQKDLTVAEYEWCLRTNAKSEDEPIFEHPGCLRQVEKEQLASETATVPRRILDKLNAYRLLLEPNMSWGINTNQMDAQFSTQRFIHQSTPEEIVMMLARAEAMCAALSLATRKDRKPIEIRIKQKQTADFQEAAARRKESATPKTVAKVERKILSKEDKAVAVLLGLGTYTEEEAREEVNARSKRNQEKVG